MLQNWHNPIVDGAVGAGNTCNASKRSVNAPPEPI